MYRKLAVFAAPVLALALAACQPAADKEAPAGSEPQPEPVAAPPAPAAEAPAAVPASYDWSWRAHGGSADLDFGDGDWAEGVSLFHLSCLPNSQNVSISWGNAEAAKLSSGGHELDLAAHDAAGAATDPVFKALRVSGELSITQASGARTLIGKEPGKKALEAFFAYCTTPLKA